MPLVHVILNVACLLLWLNWRSARFDPLSHSSPATLLGTLRRADPRRFPRWPFLLALMGLLLLRAWLYWQIGPAVNWTPTMHLGAIAIYFRPDFFGRMALFSLLSFLGLLALFYLWLLLLSVVTSRGHGNDPIHRLMRVHLGMFDSWPRLIKALLALPIAALLWLILAPLLTYLHLLPSAPTRLRVEQALLMGLSAYLTWKYLIGGLLFLFLLSDYIYFGNHWFWSFVSVAGRNLLVPLRWLPLRLGKVDFAPVVGIVLVFLAAELGERGLSLLYERLP